MYFSFRYLHSPKVYSRALRIRLRSRWNKEVVPPLKAIGTKVPAATAIAGFAFGAAWAFIDFKHPALAVVTLIVVFVALAIAICGMTEIPDYPAVTRWLKVVCFIGAFMFTSAFAVIAYKNAGDSSSSMLPSNSQAVPAVPIPAQTVIQPPIIPSTKNVETIRVLQGSSESPAITNPRPTVVQHKKKRTCKWEETILGTCA